jgi:hypothetical protein
MAERGLFRWAGAKRHLVDRKSAAHPRAPRCDRRPSHLALLRERRDRARGRWRRDRRGCFARAARTCTRTCRTSVPRKCTPRCSTRQGRPRTPEAYKAVREAHGLAAWRWVGAVPLALGDGLQRRLAGEQQGRDEHGRRPRPARARPTSSRRWRPSRHSPADPGTKFVRGWENAARCRAPGDVVFADPPYGEFDGYTADGFESRDHRLLAGALRGSLPRTGRRHRLQRSGGGAHLPLGEVRAGHAERAASRARRPSATPSASSSSPRGSSREDPPARRRKWGGALRKSSEPRSRGSAGRARAAHLVWAAFGDVPNYVEPFFGSGAVLLGRPTSRAPRR